MKSGVLVLLLGCLIFQTLAGQNSQLILTKRKTDKAVIVNQGQMVTVFSGKTDHFQGELNILNESKIALVRDTLLLSSITKIRAKTQDSKNEGTTLIICGSVLAVAGIILVATYSGLDSFDQDVAGPYLLAAAIPVTIGAVQTATTGIIYTKSGKYYKSKKWNYSTR